jgi:hypothetical protein
MNVERTCCFQESKLPFAIETVLLSGVEIRRGRLPALLNPRSGTWFTIGPNRELLKLDDFSPLCGTHLNHTLQFERHHLLPRAAGLNCF